MEEQNEFVTEIDDQDVTYIDNERSGNGAKAAAGIAAGGTVLALAAIAFAKRKAIAQAIDKARAEHHRKALEKYEARSIVYEELTENQKETNKK